MSDQGTAAPLLIQVAQLLQRARKLPIGRARNEMRELAWALWNLHMTGVNANVQIIERPRRRKAAP